MAYRFVEEESEEALPKGFRFVEKEQIEPQQKKTPYFINPEESGLQNINRYLGQLGSAGVTLATWPGAVSTMIGTGEAANELNELEERIPRLKKLFPNAPWENFESDDIQKAREKISDAVETGPTPSNFIGMLEEATGLPFEPKTKGQKLLNFIATAAGFANGTASEKIHQALKAASYSSAMQAGGANEQVADLTGLWLMNYGFPKGQNIPKEKGIAKKPELENIETNVPPGEPPLGGPPEGGIPPDYLTEKPLFQDLVPEHEILEQVQPFLQKSLEEKIGEPPKIIDIKEEVQKLPPRNKPFELEREIGKEVSPVRIPNQGIAARAAHEELNKISNKNYNAAKNAYEISRRENLNYREIDPQLYRDLEDIIENIDEAPVPSAIQKDIKSIAKNFQKIVAEVEEDNIIGYLEVPVSRAIAQIEAINKKIDFEYLQGNPKNAYIPLKKALNDFIERTRGANPRGVESYNNAKQLYADWANTFQSDQILPWRQKNNAQLVKTLRSAENPDMIEFLQPILGRTKKGNSIYNSIRRDFVEKQLRPFIKDPNKIDTLEYNDTIRELNRILKPQERNNIEERLYKAQENATDYEKAVKQYNEGKISHAELVKKQKKEIDDWKKKANQISRDFPYKNDSAILRDMTDVRGLKRLENALPKTPEGQQMMDQIKDYASVRLLTQGKINPSDKAEPLRKILNDVDKRALLEFTLGKSITNDLREIVNNVPRIDKRVSLLKSKLASAKTVSKLVPGLRGHIASGEALYELWHMFKPTINKGAYETVDMALIREIIENRRELLSK